MKEINNNPLMRSTKHTDVQQEPPRVAARLEGVVRNKGIKPKKKVSKTKELHQA
jgi:hypothetical protein